MKKLNQEQIKFIDTYLQKSEVQFYDVRIELIDHIASAVEQKMNEENSDFYDAFKEFMVYNKKEILKSKNYFLPAMLNFGKSLYKPYNIAIAFMITLLFYFGLNYVDQNSLSKLHLIMFYGIISLALFQGIYTHLILKRRFVYSEKAMYSLSIIYYLNLIINGFIDNFYGNAFSLGISLFLFLAFVIHYIEIVKTVRKKYSYL